MSVRKRSSYSISFKLRAVEVAERVSKESAARQFKVDSKRIREWCSQKEKLLKLLREEKEKGSPERKRLSGGGRKLMDESMEEALFQWIACMSSQNFRVSREMIKRKAKELSKVPNFKASQGWLQRFMKRKGVSVRQSIHCASAEYLPALTSEEDMMHHHHQGYNIPIGSNYH